MSEPFTISYQTIRLSRGKHPSPREGACVMELASMLAEEPFSDRPQAVCPVIGALLREYNDALDDDRRQDLYEYASRVVGTRGSCFVERRRLDRIVQWTSEASRRRRWLTRHLAKLPIPPGAESANRAAVSAVGAIGRGSDAGHRRMLTLIDELCALGPERSSRCVVEVPADGPLSPSECERTD